MSEMDNQQLFGVYVSCECNKRLYIGHTSKIEDESYLGSFRARKIKLRNLLDDVFYNNKSLNFREVQRLEEDLVQLKTQLEKLIGCDKEWLNLSFLPKISKKTK